MTIDAHWAGVSDRVHALRTRHDDAMFYDMDYRSFITDPIAEVERIYAYFGFDLLDEALVAMRKWHESRPQGRHGEHRYAAEDFGLTDAMVRDRFADYRTRHDLT